MAVTTAAASATPDARGDAAARPLALPTGDATRAVSAAPLGAILAAVGGLTFVGALVSAYIGLKVDQRVWLPEGVEIDNYLGTTLATTGLLGSVVVEWAAFAARIDKTAQSVVGFAFTAMLGAAAANLGWYSIQLLEVDASSHPYVVVHTAMIGTAVLLTTAVTGLAVITAFRASSRQLLRFSGQARATAWLWHLVAATWVAVWATIFIYR